MKYFALRKTGEDTHAIGKAFRAEGCQCGFHQSVEILPERYATEFVALQITEQYNSDLEIVKNLFIQTNVEFL